MSGSSSAQTYWEGFLLRAVTWLLQATNPGPFRHLIHGKQSRMLVWVSDGLLSLSPFSVAVVSIRPGANIHLPTLQWADPWDLMRSVQGSCCCVPPHCVSCICCSLCLALWLHMLCSWLGDDEQHLVCGFSEQKKVAGRDKLHQGASGLKGALRWGHSLAKCCGSKWLNRSICLSAHDRS